MEWLKPHIQYIETVLAKYETPKKPNHLYEPIRYILNLGGKRVRPAILMAVADAYGAPKNMAIHAGIAVEVFHNFTLVHDDIMDEAPLRRGKETVHQKWNTNIAILSGDAMLVQVYGWWNKIMLPNFTRVLNRFNQTAIEVCEGQQYDMDFESRNDVTSQEYLEMIRLKTAVLLGFSMECGALIAQAGLKEAQQLYNIGESLGIAFQLKDDLLDSFPENDQFGKQEGGDILSGKKTMLYLRTLELANAVDRDFLLEKYAQTTRSEEDVLQIREMFSKYQLTTEMAQWIDRYTVKALDGISGLSCSESLKENLRLFADQLKERTF